ncbi:hypothetical protein Tco_1447362 [Tanacetum coccineum]
MCLNCHEYECGMKFLAESMVEQQQQDRPDLELVLIKDQFFKVNADLLHEALQITPKDFDHPFVQPPLENEIISFIKKLRYPKDLEQVSKMIDYRKISSKKKELLPFSRFRKLIIKHILSKNNNVSKGHHSNQHVIKLDAVLGYLKFANKGAKDLIYGMAIPLEMMNDEIKASADYLDYLAKSKGETPVKGRGLLTKKGVTVAVEKVETVQVPKKKRIETGIRQKRVEVIFKYFLLDKIIT